MRWISPSRKFYRFVPRVGSFRVLGCKYFRLQIVVLFDTTPVPRQPKQFDQSADTYPVATLTQPSRTWCCRFRSTVFYAFCRDSTHHLSANDLLQTRSSPTALSYRLGIFRLCQRATRHSDCFLYMALVKHQNLAKVPDHEEDFLNLFLPRIVSVTWNLEVDAADRRVIFIPGSFVPIKRGGFCWNHE